MPRLQTAEYKQHMYPISKTPEKQLKNPIRKSRQWAQVPPRSVRTWLILTQSNIIFHLPRQDNFSF